MSLRRSLRATFAPRKAGLLMSLLATLTLGLAPFSPHPHVWKQLVNLWRGQLRAPIDIFDLCLHGAPWIWLLVALGCWLVEARRESAQRGQPRST